MSGTRSGPCPSLVGEINKFTKGKLASFAEEISRIAPTGELVSAATMEYDTWVPTLKHAFYRVPSSVRWAVALATAAYLVVSARESLFYLALIVAGNAALWAMERWTAGRDRAAIEAGVATGGWGSMERMKEEREVKRRAKPAAASAQPEKRE